MGSFIWTDNYSNQIIFKKSEFGTKFKIKFIPEEIQLTQILTLFQEEWYRVFAITLSDFSYRPNIY
ncbi:hypothetical protein BpHYR1_008128 [Brachionus plicatilis]|uniref:Uncharacterized protein n=1 Tax=Brachionus plicatilis TaxID=10195 RepID=A0A3M7R213_BRAPC|nr:hypothetical protein BpHYR1_008128 [Brachionus plicatilis]